MQLRINRYTARLAVSVCLTLLLAVLLAPGCGKGKPTVIVFLGKSSSSYEEMTGVINGLKKKYGDQVKWETYDYDSPASTGAIEKYKVSMNPTVIIKNVNGEIKQTYMGSAREDMLSGTIESFIPDYVHETVNEATPEADPGATPLPTDNPNSDGETGDAAPAQ